MMAPGGIVGKKVDDRLAVQRINEGVDGMKSQLPFILILCAIAANPLIFYLAPFGPVINGIMAGAVVLALMVAAYRIGRSR
jgi:hypothetical protein